jgi:hypothetical protein
MLKQAIDGITSGDIKKLARGDALRGIVMNGRRYQ